MEKYYGIGLDIILFLLLLVLKLTETINWSWLWVTAPIWIPTILVILAIILLSLIKID